MKYVSFTFDDGRRDNFTCAYPVMKKHGIPGTLFCTTGYIDGTWQKDESWHSAGEAIHVDELKELQQNGWELALHGDKHITELALDNLEYMLDLAADGRFTMLNIPFPINRMIAYFG